MLAVAPEAAHVASSQESETNECWYLKPEWPRWCHLVLIIPCLHFGSTQVLFHPWPPNYHVLLYNNALGTFHDPDRGQMDKQIVCWVYSQNKCCKALLNCTWQWCHCGFRLCKCHTRELQGWVFFVGGACCWSPAIKELQFGLVYV